MSDLVSTHKEAGGVVVLTLHAGKVNAVNPKLVAAFHAALDAVEADSETRALVIASARERVFCGGFDLALFASQPFADAVKNVQEGVRMAVRVLKLPFPVVAAVRGSAVAFGTFLAMSCDYRVASPEGASGIRPFLRISESLLPLVALPLAPSPSPPYIPHYHTPLSRVWLTLYLSLLHRAGNMSTLRPLPHPVVPIPSHPPGSPTVHLSPSLSSIAGCVDKTWVAQYWTPN